MEEGEAFKARDEILSPVEKPEADGSQEAGPTPERGTGEQPVREDRVQHDPLSAGATRALSRPPALCRVPGLPIPLQ